jgi:trans-aconitate methyltransferase
MTQDWRPDEYARHAAFVPAYGLELIRQLNPQPGERILDLGCGDGTLTKEIAALATVVGVDRSADMVAAALARGIDARLIDIATLSFDSEFDAVFSNAVLHWIRAQDRVLAGVHRALKPGGRFVAELGGHGNVAAIAVAIREALEQHGCPAELPWYYPTAAEYREQLERHHFIVDDIELFARFTALPTGMAGWLDTFARGILDAVPPDRRDLVRQSVIDALRPVLCDRRGQWSADYVRLRFVARRSRIGN